MHPQNCEAPRRQYQCMGAMASNGVARICRVMDTMNADQYLASSENMMLLSMMQLLDGVGGLLWPQTLRKQNGGAADGERHHRPDMVPAAT